MSIFGFVFKLLLTVSTSVLDPNKSIKFCSGSRNVPQLGSGFKPFYTATVKRKAGAGLSLGDSAGAGAN